MDIRNGDTYETCEDAIAHGVPAADIAEIVRYDDNVPIVRFQSGPFRGRAYKRVGDTGQLVRVDNLTSQKERAWRREDRPERTYSTKR